MQITLKKKVTLPTKQQILENTQFQKKYVGAVIETLKWLADGAPEDEFNGFTSSVAFDMDQYINATDCGTTCCMAGAIRLFYKHKLPRIDSDNYIEQHFNARGTDDLGPDLYNLFYEYKGSDPEQAFITLYNYCVTGTVDWNNQRLHVNNS